MNIASHAAPRVAVMGAGAVGSYFGAMLARAGVPVRLIGRAAHVEAVARAGLRFESHHGDWQVVIPGSTDPAAAREAELVLVAVKSGDTEAAARELAPHLRTDALVLSLQNGVDNAERLAALLPVPALPALVYVAAALPAPGHLRHTGRGDLVIGARAGEARVSGAQIARIAALFESAGVPCRVSGEIELELWTKLVINCAYNAVSALGGADYGTMAARPEVLALMHAAARETVAVARAGGVMLEEAALIAAVDALAPAMPRQVSSTAQDLARRRPSEIDHLNGLVVKRGAALGVVTPVNQALWALVRLRESAMHSSPDR